MDRRIRLPDPFKLACRSASLDGYSLHAGVRIHENDREGLERLCRYAVRPPLALHRLSRGEDGRLVYRMKRARGGAMHLVLTPDELVARLATLVAQLATLVPPPRSHALRYQGLFAPNSRYRARVIPAGASRREKHACGPCEASAPSEREFPRDSIRAASEKPPETPPSSVGATVTDGHAPRYRVPWAELLLKVFAIDVLECPRCASRLEVIAFIADGRVARRILEHLGMQSRAPPVARATGSQDQVALDPFPDYSVADPWYDD